MKMMNKLLLCLMLVVGLFCTGMKGVYAYQFPDNAYYIEVRDSYLGQVTIYIPYNSLQSLSLQENSNQIINIGSSSVRGYINYQGDEISVTWQVFEYGTYYYDRDSRTLNIQQIIDTNIEFLDDFDVWIYQNQDLFNISAFLIGGGLLLLLLLKR